MKKISILGWVILLLALFVSCNSDELNKLIHNSDESSAKIAAIDQQIVKINESLSQLEKADNALETLIGSLKEEDSSIKSSLESAKKALEDKIADLKAYVDDELKNTKNWASATFATLEQYQSLCDEVASLRSLLENLNIDSIFEAFDDLEKSMKTWVNSQLANYYTIAEVNAKLEALQNAITGSGTESAEEISTLLQKLETVKSELTEAYQAAIEEAIKKNNGVINQKIADDIKAATDAMQEKLDGLSSRIDAIESRVAALEEKVAKIISGVQSVVVVPDYSDGSVRLSNIADNKIRFVVYPLEAAKAIAETGPSILSLDYVETLTKSSENFVNLPITAVVFSGKTLTLTVDGTGIPETIISGASSANARLRISDGTNTRSSEYFPIYKQNGGSEPMAGIAITGEAVVCEASAFIYGWCNQNGSIGVSLSFGFEYSLGDLSYNPETVFSDVRESDNKYYCHVSGLNPNTLCYYRAFTLYNGTKIYGEVRSFTTAEKSTVEFEAVDLGLSVKWANMNVGASTPEEYGKYFAWGETEIKGEYSWSTYKFGTFFNGARRLSKYNTKADHGTVDGKTELELADDVAHVILGGNWRMPTDSEWTELRNRCEWERTIQNGINGKIVTGPNGNSIFLPDAGSRTELNLNGDGEIGLYWSSSLYKDYPETAWYVHSHGDYLSRTAAGRDCGFPVRPVSE